MKYVTEGFKENEETKENNNHQSQVSEPVDTFFFEFMDVGSATSLLHYSILPLFAKERQALGYSKQNTIQQIKSALEFSTRPEACAL